MRFAATADSPPHTVIFNNLFPRLHKKVHVSTVSLNCSYKSYFSQASFSGVLLFLLKYKRDTLPNCWLKLMGVGRRNYEEFLAAKQDLY